MKETNESKAINESNTANGSSLPCDTVRDLFPSYIDGLTSDTTNALLEAHLEGCGDCREVLGAMRTPEAEPSASAGSDGKVIDFLKKNRMRNLKIMLGSVAGAIVLAVGILVLRLFVIGEEVGGDWIVGRVTVSGSDILMEGCPTDSARCISKVTFEEKDGVITARTRAVLAGLQHDGTFRVHYTAKGDFSQICLNDRILWDDGETISALASAVYQTRHPYMGSISDNMRTANALYMTATIGGFTSELQTASQPYGWRILLREDIPASEQSVKELRMKHSAYALLGVIGNLDEVTYVYTVNGQPLTLTVTSQEASDVLGQDIKDCGKSPRLLHSLLQKTGMEIEIMNGES